MADEQQADPDNSPKTTAPAQGDDWGSDWESAFQADEFLLDETAGNPPLAEADAFSFAEEVSPEDQAQDDREAGSITAVDAAAKPDRKASGPGPLSLLTTRFLALPKVARLGIPAALLLLLAGVTLFRLLQRPAQPPPAVPLEHAAAESMVSPLAPAPPPPLAIAPEAAAPTMPLQEEKVHTTWPFSSFIIPIADEDNKAVSFATVDLSLIIAQDHEQDGPPLAQTPFVRDTIFQFFVNRPPSDLRRFALAQGEMNTQLLEWLRKQWPAGEIESLTIDSYKLD